ncbi:MAG: 16S rRNA (guanine(966)-N(2))-methyltransferase RsmD [Thermoflexales bacterium]|nr:16S rRNA (guanine(966)-N(2))-methyltransferase RsmD [Thermoflexales bacterium]
MRVTTGSARGKALKSVPGETTRPITDRVKQALFNILMDETRDTVWLDLFAGTGAVGIEALSRGARQAVFVDREREAIQTIQDNLSATRLAERARVIRQDAFAYLGGRPNQRYDFIFIAPPQYAGLWMKALIALDGASAWLKDEGTVIVQIDPVEYQDLPLKTLEAVEERRYGNTLLVFYERPAAEPDDGGDDDA